MNGDNQAFSGWMTRFTEATEQPRFCEAFSGLCKLKGYVPTFLLSVRYSFGSFGKNFCCSMVIRSLNIPAIINIPKEFYHIIAKLRES